MERVHIQCLNIILYLFNCYKYTYTKYTIPFLFVEVSRQIFIHSLLCIGNKVTENS